MNWLSDAQRHGRDAVRALQASPGFAVVTVLTVGFSIAAMTVLVALADAVIVKPYPFADPSRLVIGGEALTEVRAEVSYPDFRAWQERARSFEAVAAMGLSNWTATLREDVPEHLLIRAVSGNWFDVMGVGARMGRALRPTDDVRGAPRVVVLGDGLWRRRFGARPDIVGRVINLDNDAVTVVGVMSGDFSYPAGAEAWTPLVPTLASIRGVGLPDLLESRDTGFLHVVARLGKSVSLEDARRELTPLVAELASERSGGQQVRVRLTPLVEEFLGSSRFTVMALVGAAGLLLLASLANAAGLMHIRAFARRQDVTLRRALGASPASIARGYLAESLLVCTLSGAVGVVLAGFGLPVLLRYVPDIPRVQRAVLDTRTLTVVTAVVALATLACWIPLWLGMRRAAHAQVLQASTRHVSGRVTVQAFVAFEIATAVVLLAGSALLYRSVQSVQGVDLGFEATRLLAVTVPVPDAVSGDHGAALRFRERIIDDLRTLPVVEQVGATSARPLKGPIGLDSSWQVDRQSPDASRDNPWANIETVTPGYLETMQTRLIEGRLLEAGDDEVAPRVALVSEALARRAWPGTPAVGRRLRAAAFEPPDQEAWYTVVGVVANVRYRALGASTLDIYVPLAQSPWEAGDVMVRVRGDDEAAAALIRSRVQAAVPEGVVAVDVMAQIVARHQQPWRSNLAFFALCAGLTVAVSLTGLYALVAASVVRRTREFGVRVAVGATPRIIRRHVLQTAIPATLAGAAIGTAGAFVAGRAMRALLFETAPDDAVALVAMPVLVVVVATVAVLRPAHRAASVEPGVTLRTD